MSQAIGIFDSGIGGLTVMKEISRRLPGEDLIYFGDLARAPYGPKSRDAITRFSTEVADFLVKQGVKVIVVACNTASSVALDVLRDRYHLPLVGVVASGASSAVRQTENGRVGVIGTSATISSGSYVKAMKAIDPSIKVFSQACPLFVPIVEEGWVGTQVAQLVIEKYLENLKKMEIDTLILGCTHYPILKDDIQGYMKGVRLVDSSKEVAAELESVLRKEGLLATGNTTVCHKFFTTDMPGRFQGLGEVFLGQKIRVVTQVELDT
jgi:glutamate racemase